MSVSTGMTMVHDTPDDSDKQTESGAPSVIEQPSEKEVQDKKSKKPQGWRKIPHYALAAAKDQWFIIGVAIVIIIASQVQVPAAQQARKQVVVSYLSVTLIFFITGLTLETRLLIENYAKWKHHIFVQVECFLVISALAYAVVSLAATNPNFMDPWLLIGLIFNGCMPTTIASNVMYTRKGHGNATLTVVETTLGNFLGPFISPLLIKMYVSSGAWYTRAIPPQNGGYGALYSRVFMQLGLSIYLPMFVGQVLRYFFKNFINKWSGKLKISKLGSLALLLLIWQTFDHMFSTGAFETVKQDNLIFIVFIAVVNYTLWFTTAFVTAYFWMPRKDTVAILMCVPAKTTAIVIPLSYLLFEGLTGVEEAKIQMGPIIFQVIQIACASVCTLYIKRWVDDGERKELEKKKEEAGQTTGDTQV